MKRIVQQSRRALRNLREQSSRIDWPKNSPDGSVTVVAVNYNTLVLTLTMIFSLYRVLDRPPDHIIIVDNGSSDGSLEFLAELSSLGLITLVRNETSTQHGPGLNRGVDAARSLTPRASVIWVLDSDVFIVRSDALSASREHLRRSGCPLIGPLDSSLATQRLPDGYAHVSCLLLDPRRVWAGRTPVFLDHGDPGRGMQEALLRLGEPAGFFPFYQDGYAVHLGRATLMHVAATGETSHPLYGWAVTHNEHHYAGNPDGPVLHRRIGRAMQDEVGELTPPRFATACQKVQRIRVDVEVNDS